MSGPGAYAARRARIVELDVSSVAVPEGDHEDRVERGCAARRDRMATR